MGSDSTLRKLIEAIGSGGTSKKIDSALTDLTQLLKSRYAAANLSDLDDVSYRDCFQALFTFVLREKSTYYEKSRKGTAATSANRLSQAAESIRTAATHAAPKITPKTVISIIDHITQVLPGPNELLVPPLRREYVKTLTEVLSVPRHTEFLCRKTGAPWQTCVEFFLDVIIYTIPNPASGSNDGSIRGSPMPGTPSPFTSLTSSALPNSNKQHKDVDKLGDALTDALQGLLYLISTPNAPVLGRFRDLTAAALRVLRIHGLSLGRTQTLCFGIINTAFASAHTEDPKHANELLQELFSLMNFWWKPEKVAQDQLIRTLRSEITRTVLLTQLNIECAAEANHAGELTANIEYFLETLWQEYSRRSDVFKLGISDITFNTSILAQSYLHVGTFGLRTHNSEAESQWALIYSISFLEVLLFKQKLRLEPELSDNDQPQRKRRRLDRSKTRLELKLNELDSLLQYTSLQVFAFVFSQKRLSQRHADSLAAELSHFTRHKDPDTVSWAMIAMASYMASYTVDDRMADTLKQLWGITARSVSQPGTCRAACHLMHSIIERDAVPHHDIDEDLNSIVVTADVHGPAVLCDSSISLMMHLFHGRNARVPNASQATSYHIIRWIFMKWNPSDRSFASSQSHHLSPFDVVNSLRLCCGLSALERSKSCMTPLGILGASWVQQKQTEAFDKYLLLLPDDAGSRFPTTQTQCVYTLPSQKILHTADDSQSFSTRKLILELLYPKLEDLIEISSSWGKKPSEGGTQVSPERFQSLLSACVVGILLLPQLSGLNSSQFSTLESMLSDITDQSVTAGLESVEPTVFIGITMAELRRCIPQLSASALLRLQANNPGLLRFITNISTLIDGFSPARDFTDEYDHMDLDNRAAAEPTTGILSWLPVSLPRHIDQIPYSLPCFLVDTKSRLSLIKVIHNDSSQVGLVPDHFVDELLVLSDDQFLSCSVLLNEIFESDMVTTPENALKILERFGTIIGNPEYECCEVALATCIRTINGLHSVWLEDHEDLGEQVGDFYNHLIKTCLAFNFLSPQAEMSLADLLFTLLRLNPEYATKLNLDSCRTSLLHILSTGALLTKCFIAERIASLFELYILTLHDDVFVDILGSLPADPADAAGIALRLLVLSKLACKWSTLLRRCTYHIFEAPGQVRTATAHARWCMRNISKTLGLGSARDLYRLFARQLLYTWMETSSIEELPYEVFDFESLHDLLLCSEPDAVGLAMMRRQDETVLAIARCLKKQKKDLLQSQFATVLAYSACFAVTSNSHGQSGDELIQQEIGNQSFTESVHIHFVDIIASFFDLIDQEDAIEKIFFKYPDLEYAGEIVKEIRSAYSLPSKLPPNQQPYFRAKYVIYELSRLCQSTEFLLHELWTPALTVCIVRKLLSTVHPALGSLHACSVLRKVRIIIGLAGKAALESYCLEMLLDSIRVFIVDSQCADDALGITHYLLLRGSEHLSTTPSFLAGYALSTLASLRVFLESSQSSTTQESQFKATMSKAQTFHKWFTAYLSAYESPLFSSAAQKAAFQSITQAASRIRSSGNAEKKSYESKLLLDILQDADSDERLLNDPSRELALRLLCGDFAIPSNIGDDILGQDEDAVLHASSVWKSGKTGDLSHNYLSWAGRVLGRAFAANGEIPAILTRETQLKGFLQIAPSPNGSEMGLLSLLQDLTANPDMKTAGTAEAVLRTTVSQALLQEDEPLIVACQKSLREPLFVTSQWGSYRTPPTESVDVRQQPASEALWHHDVSSETWLINLCSSLASSVTDSILLSALAPVLEQVKEFSEKALPFIVHLVLLFQLDQQLTIKKALSEAIGSWLSGFTDNDKDKAKLLINTMLYLRTQEYPKEASIADRLHWLDVDYSIAAAAANRCGMFRTALLFSEIAASEASRISRRGSFKKENGQNDILLTIFENIDDPDAYYGVDDDGSLASVLAKFEYERDGAKSLAFRGAQLDQNLRNRRQASQSDAQALSNALGTLGFAGLSHSLMQSQQDVSSNPASIETTYQSARRLEMWNLPVSAEINNHSVVTYKAYQTLHHATATGTVREAIYGGYSSAMAGLIDQSLSNAAVLRNKLAALAALTELDDLINVADETDLDNISTHFEARNDWMQSGRYIDVSQILSCRGTTMSMCSQNVDIIGNSNITVANMRRLEVKSLLSSAGIYRFHQANQESLGIATTLSDMVGTCKRLKVHVDAAVGIEVANSLWDQGELSTSIRMLQEIERNSSLNLQAIPVGSADLLSKIGHQASVARLEKPRDIQKKYLEPALKELGGKHDGPKAGQAFHQFARFCDDQLQDSDGQEDLLRLQNLRKAKGDEVAELKSLVSSTKETQLRKRYDHVLAKEKQWLELDEQELRRAEQTRSEFVRLSLENYLLSLIASDDHNNDALRFTALWLQRSDEDATNKSVAKHLSRVPTRKFAPLMNQLTSRLQLNDTAFQRLLLELVYTVCSDHPYHGMYQVWSGTKARAQQKDEVAVQRVRATEKIAQRLVNSKAVTEIWTSIDKTSKYYHGLAMDRNTTKYKSGAKVPLKDSSAGHNLINCLARYRIPPPTMHIDVSATKDYSGVPIIAKLEPTMSIASGVSAPKIITAVGSNGVKYRQLVKGGHDDLRQDAIMEQVFSAVSSLLKLHRATQQRNLGIRTYKVLPLTASSGLIEFVPNTMPLHEFLMPAHERYYPRDMKGGQCRKEIFNVQNRSVDTRISTYRSVTDRFHPVMKYFFMEYFEDPDDWFARRLAYTRTTAAISMLGHVLGLGDRHGHNILLDTKTGEVVHIDLGVAFEAGRILPVPELVPFRLTRDIVDGMGVTKTEGVFRRCCEFTLDALRDEQYSIMTILDVLRYDPLYTWSIAPLRMAKLQKLRQTDDASEEDAEQSEAEGKKAKKHESHVNEPSEADRALEVVRKKLSKALSVSATVNDLINQASDERNLAVLYSGWAAYA